MPRSRLGTPRAETIRGTARADFIDPRAGRDRVIAGRGDDRIKAQDRFVDTIGCGPGRDLVTADLTDRVDRACEVVARQLSRDQYRNPESQHATEVEPDSYAFGSTIVSVFQVGRIRDGAAANIGFATSRDAGRTWRSGLLPSLTSNSTPAGEWVRASDPVIGFDAVHGVWLASSLAVSPGRESALVFNRSADGITWSAPVVATRSIARDLELDKQWFACDNWTSSPFRGRCYLAYSDFRTNRISIQTSADGGLTWSAPLGAPDNAGRDAMREGSPGVQPVARPNGDALVLYWDGEQMSSIRSTDGGATFSRTNFIGRVEAPVGLNFRAFALPVAEVDAAGTVYLAWSDCQLHTDCNGTDLMLSRSADGIAWSAPARVPTGPSRDQHARRRAGARRGPRPQRPARALVVPPSAQRRHRRVLRPLGQRRRDVDGAASPQHRDDDAAVDRPDHARPDARRLHLHLVRRRNARRRARARLPPGRRPPRRGDLRGPPALKKFLRRPEPRA